MSLCFGANEFADSKKIPDCVNELSNDRPCVLNSTKNLQTLSDEMIFDDNINENLTSAGKDKKFRKSPGKKAKKKLPKSVQDECYYATKKNEFDQRFMATYDYKNFMITITNLIDQKEKALEDLQYLDMQYKKLLNNPNGFKLEVLPSVQDVVEVPEIDFLLYELLPNELSEFPKPGDLIRGKKYSSSKPISFNRPWTFEEQRRLEKLLMEYPDEPISAYRWERIARALGNRTPKQVSSRVQKYFLRLAQKGIPVPGKIPKFQNSPYKSHPEIFNGEQNSNFDSKKPQKPNSASVSENSLPSVLFSSIELTDEEILGECCAKFAPLKHTPEYQELLKLKKQKILEQNNREIYLEPLPFPTTNVDAQGTCNFEDTELLYLNPKYMPD